MFNQLTIPTGDGDGKKNYDNEISSILDKLKFKYNHL